MMDSKDPSWDLLNTHGCLALVAMIVIFPISILVVALGAYWDLWLIAHITLVAVGAVISVASVFYGVLGSRTIGHVVTTHQILSVVFLAVVAVLMLNGVYISIRWKSTRIRAPMRDIFHWWFGRLVVLASFELCFQGFVVAGWGIWAYILATSCWFIWVIVYGVFMITMEPVDSQGDDVV